MNRLFCDTVNPPEGYEFIDPYNPDIGLRPIDPERELLDAMASAVRRLVSSLEALDAELKKPFEDGTQPTTR
jgi:hypothetical protein